jgi:hypothetical protein
MGKFLLAAAVLALSGQAIAATKTIGNAPTGSDIRSFGFPDSQTYGQVFTAPVTDVMTSFTLRLGSGLNAGMVGVLGTWNGTADWDEGFGSNSTLYTSPLVSTSGGGAFTFTPDVMVTAGTRYVAYITVFGQQGSGNTGMPLGDASDPWLNYFVWNNRSNPVGNPSWNYLIDAGNAHFTATFGDGVIPEPQSWAMLIAGFGLVGAAARRRRAAAAA